MQNLVGYHKISNYRLDLCKVAIASTLAFPWLSKIPNNACPQVSPYQTPTGQGHVVGKVTAIVTSAEKLIGMCMFALQDR